MFGSGAISAFVSIPKSQPPRDRGSRISELGWSVKATPSTMASRSLSLSICQSCLRAGLRARPASMQQLRLIPRSTEQSLQPSVRTPFSTSASPRRASNPPPPPASAADGSKPIVLEQPDKFRPPSHPQRLNTRRRFQPAAYNQGATRAEREQQKTRSYPHTFPNQGTFMHWFLTNRMIHLWITMVSFFF